MNFLAHRRLILGLSVCLLLLAGVYFLRGFYNYFEPTAIHGVDGRSRWIEARYVVRGKNPYDVAFAHVPSAAPFAPLGQSLVTRDSTPETDIGLPVEVVYPPWAFFTGALIFWTPYDVMLPYYAIIMSAGLVFLALWAAHQGRPFGGYATLLLVASTLALASWVGAIFTGNYPLVVIPLLAAVLWLDEKRHPVLAGLLLGVAFVKPTVVGPFFLALLVKRRFVSAAVCALYILLASLFTWYMTHTNPLEMLRQMSAISAEFVVAGTGMVQFLINHGIKPALATKYVGLVMGTLGFIALLASRKRDLLSLFAIAGITARLWSYHYYYDDNALLFALMVFALAAFSFKSRLAGACFLVLGGTLWMPARLTDIPAIQILENLIWIGSAVMIVWSPWRHDASAPKVDSSAHISPVPAL